MTVAPVKLNLLTFYDIVKSVTIFNKYQNNYRVKNVTIMYWKKTSSVLSSAYQSKLCLQFYNHKLLYFDNVS